MEDLIAKLESASAGSDELSARVMQVTTEPQGYVERSPFNGKWCVYRANGKLVENNRPWHRADGWPVTESLDAALALAERVLPGWSRTMECKIDDPRKPQVWSVEQDDTAWGYWENGRYGGEHDSPAIALCISTLKAKAPSPAVVQGEAA